MESSYISREYLTILPNELFDRIFRYLTVEDLCRLALCSRSCRQAANHDALWLPLCREEGWDRYGRSDELCKEKAFVNKSSLQTGGIEGENAKVAFPFDSIVTGCESPGLVGTCKWKEVYMKARHLEGNWSRNRCHVVPFEVGIAVNTNFFKWNWSDKPYVYCLAGEGDCLVVAITNGTLQVWDVFNGKLRHVIQADISRSKDWASPRVDWPDCLKMKNGIIAVGCEDGSIRTLSSISGEQLQVILAHPNAVWQVFFDGDTIVSATRSEIRVWSSVDGTIRFTFEGPGEFVALDYLEHVVAVVYCDCTVKLWDARSGVNTRTIAADIPHYMYCKPVSCHLCHGVVVVCYCDDVVRMWNVESGECVRTVDVPQGTNDDEIWSCNFSGELFVARSDSDNLKFFNPEGKYLGDTDSFYKREGDTEGWPVRPLAFRGNKLATVDMIEGCNDLWVVSRERGVDRVTELRGQMFMIDVHVDHVTFAACWMSDTKLAFVYYFDDPEDGPKPDEVQKPKIIVHHYW